LDHNYFESIIALLHFIVPALFATRLRVVGAGTNAVDGAPSPAIKRRQAPSRVRTG
jgi:hypothetical protein